MMKIFNFCASHISLEDSTFALRAKMKGVVKGHDNEGCIDPASWVKSSRAKGIGGFSPRSGEIGGRGHFSLALFIVCLFPKEIFQFGKFFEF
jgi:hypothetical protein